MAVTAMVGMAPSGAGASSSRRVSALTPPATGAAFGSFTQPHFDGSGSYYTHGQSLTLLENDLGRHQAIDHGFYNQPGSWTTPFFGPDQNMGSLPAEG